MAVPRDWLRDIRERAGKTTKEIGYLTGFTQSYYSQIENGRHAIPVRTAKKIAEALGFDWQRFYEN